MARTDPDPADDAIARPLNEAASLLRSSDKAMPNRKRALTGIANALMGIGEYAAAEQIWQDILADEETNATATIGWVEAALARGDRRAALQRIEEATTRLGTNARLSALHTRALKLEEDGAAALRDLRRRNAQDPANPAIATQLARKLMEADKDASADAVLSVLLEHTPDSSVAHHQRINIATRAQDFARVLDLCDAALVYLSDDPRILHRRAVALLRLEKTDDAARALDEAITHHPQADILRMTRASICQSIGEMDEADRHFAAVLASDPSHRGARLGRISLAEERGDLRAAAKLARDAIHGTA